MANVYDESGEGRVRVILNLDNEGGVKSILVGNRVVATEKSILFYVDENVSEQLHKFSIHMEGFNPILTLEEGEVLEDLDTNQEQPEED